MRRRELFGIAEMKPPNTRRYYFGLRHGRIETSPVSRHCGSYQRQGKRQKRTDRLKHFHVTIVNKQPNDATARICRK